MKRLCEVCGAEKRGEEILLQRGAQEVCAECWECERRYIPETGCMIERRGDYWVEITKTFARR